MMLLLIQIVRCCSSARSKHGFELRVFSVPLRGEVFAFRFLSPSLTLRATKMQLTPWLTPRAFNTSLAYASGY